MTVSAARSPAGKESAGLRQPFALPFWLVSLLFHSALLAVISIASVKVAKGLPQGEQTMNVGIALRSETEKATLFETKDDLFEEPRAGQLAPTPTQDPLDQSPRPSPSSTLDSNPVELPLLATGGRAMEEATRLLPQTQLALGGGRTKTRFFKAEAVGSSFVFVIDRSASMSHRNAFGLAKIELLRALEQLSEDSSFQIIFYNDQAEVLRLEGGNLVKATKANLDKMRADLAQREPSGGTEHHKALLRAFDLQPEVIYFLTDADMMSNDDVRKLTAANRRSRRPATIYTIEFGNGTNIAEDKPLRRLAGENDGTYTYVNVQSFGP